MSTVKTESLLSLGEKKPLLNVVFVVGGTIMGAIF